MAKYSGVVHLRGKLNDQVFTDGKHGPAVRASPVLTKQQREAKKKLPQLTTGKSNAILASQISATMKEYAAFFTPSDYYTELLKQFGKTRTQGRILRIAKLRLNDVHLRQRFGDKLLYPDVKLTVHEDRYAIEAKIDSYKCNAFEENEFKVQFILMTWDGDGTLFHDEVTSVPMAFTREKSYKLLNTEFSRGENDEEYLLACAIITSVNGFYEKEYSPVKGIFYAEADALTEDGKEFLRKHRGDSKYVTKERVHFVSKKPAIEVRELT